MQPPAIARNCRVWRNIRVAMRDGVTLATTVYLPLSEGPYPVVLVRNAYNRVGFQIPELWNNGIALVSQDVRGRYDSAGEFYPFINEEADGYDTLEWLHRQPWCNGKIGMLGASYLAGTQLYAVSGGGAKFLTAINPQFMTGDGWKRAYYCDGVFSIALTWSWLCFECSARTSEAGIMPVFDVRSLLWQRPLLTLDETSGAPPVSYYRDYVRHCSYDEHWKRVSLRGKGAMFTMPTLWTAGWYDYYAGETFTCFDEIRRDARSPEIAAGHRLIVGPWTHGLNGSTVLGELDFGAAAHAEDGSTMRWLQCLLKDGKPAEFQAAPIRLFVMGLNQWRDEYEWPLARTRFTDYYLHTGGRLDTAAPAANEAPEPYTYDPQNPVPTTGGNHSVGPYNPGLYEFCKPGPYDQRDVEKRPDVLTFTTAELPEDTEITGPVIMKLFAASSARDTDFVARLCDVYPDGRSINITEGVIRARFRADVFGPPSLLEPGKAYAFTIDVGCTSNVFRRGHRIRLQLTSSNFPLWDPNPNTGGDPATETRWQTAQQTVFHDGARPSHLVLPLVPARG